MAGRGGCIAGGGGGRVAGCGGGRVAGGGEVALLEVAGAALLQVCWVSRQPLVEDETTCMHASKLARSSDAKNETSIPLLRLTT